MAVLVGSVAGFLSGSLPFSLWLGRLVLGVDIRGFGDGNPGAANVWRGGGRLVAGAAVLLDFLKGAVPVALAQSVLGLEGYALVPVALAPVLGHAFSPFLGFRGGKALATTFGIWAGLTLWLVPLALGLLFGLWLALVTVEGWAVLAGMLSLLGFLLVLDVAGWLLLVWAGNVAILAWKHRHDLGQRPGLRLVRR